MLFSYFFVDGTGSRYSKACACKRFRAQVRWFDSLGSISRRILTPTVDAILKQSNYEATPYLLPHFKQSECPRRLFGDKNP